MSEILAGLSLMTTADFLSASFPLFDSGEVDLLEFSFDSVWGREIPDWASELIELYSCEGALLGHGVQYSAFSGGRSKAQEKWLDCFDRECKSRSYLHISEHFGFCRAGAFVANSPLPVPYTKESFRLARERLEALQQLSGRKIGLENLAFAFSLADLRSQVQFLGDLLAELRGFLLLDLHNLYCQMHNFDLDDRQALEMYPLDLVNELHVSGGSWSFYLDDRIRRDTHDNEVPEEVFGLLETALKLCPNLRYVIFERLENTIRDENEAIRFREDFARIKAMVAGAKNG